MKISGASLSEITNPRNSSGSRTRKVLLPTQPLMTIKTPRASTVLRRNETASSQVLSWLAHDAERPRVFRISLATDLTPSFRRALPTNGCLDQPSSEAKFRYQDWRSCIACIVSRRSGLSFSTPLSFTVRKSGMGTSSGGGSSRKKKPIGVCVSFESRSSSTNVSLAGPSDCQFAIFGNFAISALAVRPERSTAQRITEGLISTRSAIAAPGPAHPCPQDKQISSRCLIGRD